jgi:transposase
MLTRYRVQLMGDRTREATRLEGMLEDASIKLSVVASSLTTVSAPAILAALIDGERDPRVLTEALIGHFDAGHAQLARSMLHRLELIEDALEELNAVIATACRPWAHQLELLQTIPGVGERGAQVILAETGGDMSRFPSAAHLAAWAGVAPTVYESAGKRSPTGARHGNKWLTTMLVEAAAATARIKGANSLSAQHARLTARRETGRAQVAVAHLILVSAYYMLTNDEPYRELGADWLARRNDEAHTRRLVAQLERLGHTVVLDPAAGRGQEQPGLMPRALTRACSWPHSPVSVGSRS